MFRLGLLELIVMFFVLAVFAAIIVFIVWIIKRSGNKSIKTEGGMFCTKCGTQNDDSSSKCIKCGNVLQRTASGQSVPNYLVQAILVTIFCCLPFGIPAIVFAAQVNGKLASGDHSGALETSKKAKMWCWVSFWVGLSVVILYMLAIMIPLMLGGSKSY